MPLVRMDKVLADMGLASRKELREMIKSGRVSVVGQVEKRPEVLRRATDALKKAGLEPKFVPIRGGTDGARLSFMGLTCPNLGTGGRNYHGVFEFACVREMETAVEVLKHLILG